jgi:hypothetical protein
MALAQMPPFLRPFSAVCAVLSAALYAPCCPFLQDLGASAPGCCRQPAGDSVTVPACRWQLRATWVKAEGPAGPAVQGLCCADQVGVRGCSAFLPQYYCRATPRKHVFSEVFWNESQSNRMKIWVLAVPILCLQVAAPEALQWHCAAGPAHQAAALRLCTQRHQQQRLQVSRSAGHMQ